MIEIKGICPIIATPFTPAGAVDEDSMRHLIRVVARGGCHALTLFAIAGEYYKLSEVERARMIDLVVAECRAAGVPSIISVTEHASELAVQQARAARRSRFEPKERKGTRQQRERTAPPYHSERSEGSRCDFIEILHFVQNDNIHPVTLSSCHLTPRP